MANRDNNYFEDNHVPPNFGINPEILNQIFSCAEKLTAISQQYYSALNNISPLLDELASVSQQYSSITESIGKAALTIEPYLKQIGEYVLQYQEAFKRQDICKPFVECGFWLTPSMTPNLVSIILQKYDQRSTRAIPATIEGFYRSNNYEHLVRAVNDWSTYEYFIPRMKIFTDSLEAHISRKYTLSIPALLPHIEGIAGEILLASGFELKNDAIVMDKGAKTYPSSLFGKLKASDVTPTMYLIILSWLNYLESTLYAYCDFKKYPKNRHFPKLNRHAVLHGYQINYATRINSLRCFLALDTLSMLKGNVPKLI